MSLPPYAGHPATSPVPVAPAAHPPSGAVSRPRAVRLARTAGWFALGGGVFQFALLMAWFHLDVQDEQLNTGDLVGTTIMVTVMLLPLLAGVPWAVLRATNGRAAARVVVFLFAPAAAAVALGIAIVNTAEVFRGNESASVEAAALGGVPGGLVFVGGLTTAAVCLLSSAARRYSAGFRRPERAHRGRRLLLIATIFAALAVVLAGIAAVYPFVGAVAGQLPGRPTVPGLRTSLTLAAGVTAGTALLEFVLAVCALVTRLRGTWRVRAVAAVLADVTLPLMVGGWIFLIRTREDAEVEVADAVDSGLLLSIFLYFAVLVLHFVVTLQLALPSVSTWLARPRTPAVGSSRAAAPGHHR